MTRDEWGPPQPFAAARSLGKYDIVAAVGRGGMADVFLAVARGPMRFDKLVVVKRLRAALAEDAAFRDMFVDEARLAARINHPHVVHTYEVDAQDGAYFIAMEYLEGQPLSAIVRALARRGERLEIGLAVRIVCDVLEGLHHAHELRDYDDTPLAIVHRDVSPENIFVTYDGQVKVVDFGIAKATLTSTSTDSGVLKGKAGYMAPEQALGHAIDRRADVFATGIVLWELLAGRRLFAGDSAAATVHRVLSEVIPSLRSLPIDALREERVDAELDSIVQRALAREAEARFASAGEMRAQLATYASRRTDGSRAALGARVSSLFAEEREVMHRQVQAFMETGLAARDRDEAQPASVNGMTTARGLASPSEEAALYDDLPETVPHGTVRHQRRRQRAWLLAAAAMTGAAGVGAALSLRARPAASIAIAPPVTSARAAPAAPLLRLAGSNTIGAELAPLLAEAFLARRGVEHPTRRPTGASHELLVTSAGGSLAESIAIRAEGTSTAFTSLAAGDCDVGMASRRIHPSEIDLLAKKGLGDMSSPASEHVLGLDGIAVVVNANSPLRALDLAQLRDLFSGDVRDWRDLGAPPGPVTLYARDDRSGTYDTFRQLVLGDRALAAGARRFADSAALADAVASDVSGVGFIGLVYVRNAKPVGVRDHDAEALYPSTFTVATEDYPLSRRLFLYTPVAASPAAQEFVSFALSEAGQRVVKEAGFVDLRVFARDAEPCAPACAPRYAALARRARRLSVDFRFDRGSTRMDSRAIRDIDRLLAFLRPRVSPRIVLVGFSERAADPRESLRLSRERAEAVRAELVAHGLPMVTIEALGPSMPLASELTDLHGERSRRVEVWLERD